VIESDRQSIAPMRTMGELTVAAIVTNFRLGASLQPFQRDA
jgi:hypothetical protein